jgi:hypothetical protein
MKTIKLYDKIKSIEKDFKEDYRELGLNFCKVYIAIQSI